MNITSIAKTALKPGNTAAIVFSTVGATKLIADCKEAKTPERRKKIFLKDMAILAGTATGYSQTGKWIKKFPQKTLTKFVNHNVVKKSIEHTEYVVKDCISNSLQALGGLIGAIGMNELISSHIVHKHQDAIQKSKDTSSTNRSNLSNKTADIFVKNGMKFRNTYHKNITESGQLLTNLADVPELRMFSSSMLAIEGFQIMKEKGLKNKIKRTSYDLIANTTIPLFCIAIGSAFTRGKSLAVKIPVMLSTAIGGAALGKNISTKYFSNTKNPLHPDSK